MVYTATRGIILFGGTPGKFNNQVLQQLLSAALAERVGGA
jgi:hypothetical protein